MMRLNMKLTVLFLLVGIIPMALSWFIAYTRASSSLTDQAFAQLVSVRESKKAEIEGYFNTIRGRSRPWRTAP